MTIMEHVGIVFLGMGLMGIFLIWISISVWFLSIIYQASDHK
jgi:hypothetical protein